MQALQLGGFPSRSQIVFEMAATGLSCGPDRNGQLQRLDINDRKRGSCLGCGPINIQASLASPATTVLHWYIVTPRRRYTDC